MATYIVLIDFTDRGVQNIQDSTKREEDFTIAAAELGVKVIAAYWCNGPHDGVLIADSPDDKTATALLLQLAASGNVRTQLMRAYDRDEIEQILEMAK